MILKRSYAYKKPILRWAVTLFDFLGGLFFTSAQKVLISISNNRQ